MSFKDLFSKDGRKERSLQKSCAKARNKKIKPDDRRPALYTLIEATREWAQLEEAKRGDAAGDAAAQRPASANGAGEALQEARRRGEEAVCALLGRFTFIYDTNMVNDEEEKNMVYEGLLALGTLLLAPLRAHLRGAPTLSWGLRLLNDICDHETTWQVLEEVLQDYDPEYERDPTRKLQLMTFLGDFRDPRAVDVLLPFLGDHDETVRFVTAEALFKQGDERAREPLLELLTSEEEESLRIKHRIADGLAHAGWPIKGFRGTVERLLAERMSEYVVDGKGKIRLKKAREDA